MTYKTRRNLLWLAYILTKIANGLIKIVELIVLDAATPRVVWRGRWHRY